jgi:hypothetical protein
MSAIRKNKKGQTENGHMGKNMRKAELRKRLKEDLEEGKI